jgi:hypothetical protein
MNPQDSNPTPGAPVKLIDISTPKFPNTFAMVDDADYEHINQWKWRLDCDGYARAHQSINGKRTSILMHREILKPPHDMLVDHRFGNKLDNRRENLRICTRSENNRNMKPTPGRALPKGVYWHARDRRFQAQIVVNNRNVHLGYFPTASEAEAVRLEASKKYHGEFAFQAESPALVKLVDGSQALVGGGAK